MKYNHNKPRFFILFFIIFFIKIFASNLQAQTVYPIYYHIITLQKDSIHIDNRDFYIKEVIDCRDDTIKIGYIKEGLFDNKYPAKLDTNLSLALKKYFDELMPAQQNQKPIIIKISHFEISEKADANTDNGKTMIEMEFYTFTNNLYYKIYETKQSSFYTYADVTKLHEKYIRKTLIKCIEDFNTSNNKIQSNPIDYQQLISKDINNKKENEKKINKSKLYYSKLNITVGRGFGYLFGNLPQEMPKELKNYTKGLHYAQNWAFDFNFFLTNKIGIGFNYANYNTEDAIDNFKIYENDVIKYEGNITNKINIRRFGPSINYRRLYNEDNLVLNMALSFEKIYYLDDAVLFSKANKIEANTTCLLGKVSLDYYLFKNVALNFNTNMLWGNIKKIEVNGIATELEKKSNLLRSDLNFGITFNY